MPSLKHFGLPAGGALALAVLATPPAAHAETHVFRVNAGATRTVDLSLCSAVVEISAIGDHDTDVDFEIYNPAGRMIHEDYDLTDITYRTVRRSASGCSAYQLVMRNLGEVYNNVRVTLEDQ